MGVTLDADALQEWLKYVDPGGELPGPLGFPGYALIRAPLGVFQAFTKKKKRDFVHMSVATAETFSTYLEALSNTPHGTLNFFVSLASGVVWVLDQVDEDWVHKVGGWLSLHLARNSSLN